MKTSLAALLLAIAVFSPCAAQQDDATLKKFQETKFSAEKGDATAQFNLGVFYHNGEGVEKNDAEAVTWYRRSAEQGDASAQFNLGLHFYRGEGVEKDYAEAMKWYRKAAEQGRAAAQFGLGLFYQNGNGVERDYAEAVKWYRKAAEQGHSASQYNLGLHYHSGEGVEKDYAEAYAWLNLASVTDKDAAKLRDVLEKTMSPQQVGDAQKRTKELRAQIEVRLKSGMRPPERLLTRGDGDSDPGA